MRNKLDPTRFKVADVFETTICPLARVMRRELKKRNIKSLKVVYSDEEPIQPRINRASVEVGEPGNTECESQEHKNGNNNVTVKKRQTPGSAAFVPAVSGLIIAGEIVRDLLQ